MGSRRVAVNNLGLIEAVLVPREPEPASARREQVPGPLGGIAKRQRDDEPVRGSEFPRRLQDEPIRRRHGRSLGRAQPLLVVDG